MTICYHQPKNKPHQQGGAEQDYKIGCVKGKDERWRIIEPVGGNQQLNTKYQIKRGNCDQDDLPYPPVSADPAVLLMFLIFLMWRFYHNNLILTINKMLST